MADPKSPTPPAKASTKPAPPLADAASVVEQAFQKAADEGAADFAARAGETSPNPKAATEAPRPEAPRRAGDPVARARDADYEPVQTPEPLAMPAPPIATGSEGLGRPITPLILGGVAAASAFIGALTAGLFGGLSGGTSGGGAGADGARVAALEAKIDALTRSSGPSGEGAGALAVSALRSDLDALDDALEELRRQTASRGRAPSGAGAELDPGALSALTSRLDEVSAQAVEARRVADEAAAAPAAQAAAIAALDTRLKTISDALSAQRTAIDQVADATSALASRVTGVQTTGSGLSGAAAAIAFANLQEAVDAGRPFIVELEEARARFPANHHIDALERFAAEGAPTPAMLAARFRETGRAAVQAERGQGGGLADRFERAMTGVVTVRRLDAPETSAAGDIVTRAQARLADDDLAGAVAEMSRLVGPAAEVARPWLDDAQRRLGVNRDLEALRDSAIAG